MSREDQSDGRLTLSRYKRLILMGKIRLPLEKARRIVGPDCAYHLYFRHGGEAPATDKIGARTNTRRQARRRHK